MSADTAPPATGADRRKPDDPELLIKALDPHPENGLQFEAAGGNPADLWHHRDVSAPPRAELSALAHMHVRMPVGSRVAMSMRLACKLGWNHNDAAITDATFGNDAVREPPDVRAAALQYGHLHAMVMIEMNVKGRLCQIMTAMGRPYEPLG